MHISNPKNLMAGFSLLEAIVAITMVATFGLAIFSWINGLLVSVNKIERNYQKDSISRNAAEYISDLNIMSAPNGIKQLGPYELTWNSDLIEPIREGKSTTGSKNDFLVGLYQTEVKIEKNNEFIGSIKLRLVGHKGEISPIFQ